MPRGAGGAAKAGGAGQAGRITHLAAIGDAHAAAQSGRGAAGGTTLVPTEGAQRQQRRSRAFTSNLPS